MPCRVSLVLSDKGALLADPEVALSGIPATRQRTERLRDHRPRSRHRHHREIPRPRRKDQALVSEAVRRGVRAAVNQAWGKKPVCSVLLTVVYRSELK